MSQNFTSLAVIILAIFFASNTYATIMTVEIDGYVNGKPATFLNSTSVKVGDTFGFTFEYDDTQQSSQLVSVNGGEIYTLTTQLFTPAITAWWGTLPTEIAQYNLPVEDGSIAGWGTRQSWYRPSTVLNHSEWYIDSGSFYSDNEHGGYGLQLVTEYAGVLGYGWWTIGGHIADGQTARTIDSGYLYITGLTIRPASRISEGPTSPIPEPSTALLFCAGIAVLFGMRRSRARIKLAS